MTLYEMTDAAKQLYEMMTDGEIPEEAVNDTLEGMGVEGKLEDYVYIIKQLAADAEMCKAETERLKAKKQQAEKGADRLKAAILGYMTATGKAKERAGMFSLSVRKNEAVQVDDMNKLAPEYIRTKTTTEPDKTAIKKAIKSGADVDGAALVTNNSLQIK